MKKIILGLGILMMTLSSNLVFAETTLDSSNATTLDSGYTAVTVTPEKFKNPIKYENFSEFVSAVIKTAIDILIPFVVLGFIYTGFLFVKAQGKPEDIKDAKMSLWYSVIGTFILFGAYGFAQIISTTLETVTSVTP